MNVSDKIKFFYDAVKINGSYAPKGSKFPYSVIIPAAAVSLLVGAAVIVPAILRKTGVIDVKKHQEVT